jgi:hypothetical protein
VHIIQLFIINIKTFALSICVGKVTASLTKIQRDIWMCLWTQTMTNQTTFPSKPKWRKSCWVEWKWDKIKNKLTPEVHTYNSSCLGGWGQGGSQVPGQPKKKFARFHPKGKIFMWWLCTCDPSDGGKYKNRKPGQKARPSLQKKQTTKGWRSNSNCEHLIASGKPWVQTQVLPKNS